MGRELGINRIDFLDDGTAIIRHNEYNLCGRTDFTGSIANLFFVAGTNPVDYLLIPIHHEDIIEHNKPFKVHVKVEDNYWSENEFDLEYEFIDYKKVLDIVKEYIEKDILELNKENSLMKDARAARQQSKDLKVFLEFSDFIDELQEHISNYNLDAQNYFNELDTLYSSIKRSASNTRSYIMLSLSE